MKEYKVEIYSHENMDFMLMNIKNTSDTKEIAQDFKDLYNTARIDIYDGEDWILTASKRKININATDYDGSKYISEGAGLVFEKNSAFNVIDEHKELLIDLSKSAFDLEKSDPNNNRVIGDNYSLNREYLKDLSEQVEVNKMSEKIKDAFLNDYSSNQKLNEAVIEQMGGFESFSENAKDISEHGIDSGFSGFIYHNDTVGFAQDNRSVILEALKEDASEFGNESVPEMMANWKSLEGFSQDEIAEALYSNDESLEAHTSVYNAMAWYAGEKASYEYVNAIDDLEREHSLDTTFDTVQDLINSGHGISSDKVEFLNNLDNYLQENDLSVGSVTISDQAQDFGDIEIEITNMKQVNGEYLDDVTVQVDDKGVWVSGAEDTFSKVADANQDFSSIKNALDNELVNDVSLSQVQEVQDVKQEVQQKDNGMELD